MAKYFKNKQLIILSNVKKTSKTLDTFISTCKKNNVTCRIIKINNCILKLNDDGTGQIDDLEQKPITIDPDNTVILCRRGVVNNTFTKDIIRELEDHKYYLVNKLSAILDCENKYLTCKKLQSAGLPVPKTELLYNLDYLDESLEKVGNQFPVIVKLLSGTQGIGVSIIDSYNSLKSVLQTIWSLDSGIEILLQEMIESDSDLRIHVLSRGFKPKKENSKDAFILASMERTKADKDFRTNYSIGGGIKNVKLTEEQKELAINATKVLGCRWAGVDIIVDKKTGKNYILEVNSSPGTEGITKASGIDVTEGVLNFILNSSNWIMNRTEVGFLEKITVQGIGNFVARLDTGNGSKSSSIHADKIEVKNNKVIWKIGNKTFKNDLIGWTTSITGKVNDKRPLIELDLKFLGKTYKKVLISPVIRDNKSAPLLINRSFMDKAQLLINPQKVFIVTEFPEYDIDIKGNYNGIILF